MLEGKIVLINVRRTQMWIHEVNPTSTDREKSAAEKSRFEVGGFEGNGFTAPAAANGFDREPGGKPLAVTP